MVEIDYRIAARRREVAEVHARSSFSRLIWFLVMAAVAAIAVWFFRSPLLAIHEISIEGIDAAEVATALSNSGVIEGRPLISVRPSQVERALLADPRIKEASVSLHWPQRVSLDVVQRRPVAWASAGGSWLLVGEDGVTISTATQPSTGFPRLEVPWGSEPGPEALGGLAFLAELDPIVGSRTTLIDVAGELWALVDGVNVRLGRPVSMEAKARALKAVLARGVSAGATINLIAPTRPAVSIETTTTAPNSQAQVKP